jgi:hypothetical protein
MTASAGAANVRHEQNIPNAPLDEGSLLAAAEEQTGLADWGQDLTFREGLRQLIASVEAMQAAERLRPVVGAHIVRLLATRLRLQDDANRHPEVLDGVIDRPLIVTGMPRSGTTWLHELLALDPAARAPLEWEVQKPWPAPEVATYETDPRIAEYEAVNKSIIAGAPELATIHNFHGRLPQECNTINTLHFASPNFMSVYGVPDYVRWLCGDRPAGVFTTHKRVLQQLQWKGPQGRWTLKSPPHLLSIEELLVAYPDACLVQTHREPAKTVASLANFMRSRRKEKYADEPELMDPKAITRSVVDYFGLGLERGTESRRDPEVDRRFLDVAYRDAVQQPLSVLRTIYDHFGFEFTATFADRVEEHLAKPRETGHGRHRYDPEEFGVGELGLEDRFLEYRARFGHLLSDK